MPDEVGIPGDGGKYSNCNQKTYFVYIYSIEKGSVEEGQRNGERDVILQMSAKD